MILEYDMVNRTLVDILNDLFRLLIRLFYRLLDSFFAIGRADNFSFLFFAFLRFLT